MAPSPNFVMNTKAAVAHEIFFFFPPALIELSFSEMPLKTTTTPAFGHGHANSPNTRTTHFCQHYTPD